MNSVVESYGAAARSPQRVLVPAPLYHTNGFTATRNLMAGEDIVLLERFNAAADPRPGRAVPGDGFHRRHAHAPAPGPGARHRERDLSSLDWVQQGASPLPVWLGRRWCELVGPEHFFLSYGASEVHGLACCRGDEWLAHPGTLGRPLVGTEVKILDPTARSCPPGEIGGIYMRTPTGPAASYVGDNVTQLAADRRRVRHGGRPGLAGRGRLPVHGRPPGGHDRHRRRPTSTRPRWSRP